MSLALKLKLHVLTLHLEEMRKGKDAEGKKIKADLAKVAGFRRSLSNMDDIYCVDAFGIAHRAHSSMGGDGFPAKCSGFLLVKELEYFAKVVDSPTKPVSGILGGANVADKIQLTMNLLDKVDIMIIGGGMAFTTIKEVGVDIGSSLYDAEGEKLVPEIKKKAAEKGVELILPVDNNTTHQAQAIVAQVAGLQKALADLSSSQAEMDRLREVEGEAYKKNRADLEQGLDGVKLALKVLSDYYDSDASDNAAEGAGSSIIGLLEVAESDLEKELAEVIATEEMAVATFEKETKEDEIDKVTKEQDVKYKTKEADELDAAVAEATADKTGVQAELDPVLNYLNTLEDRCIAKAETYEEKMIQLIMNLLDKVDIMIIGGGMAFTTIKEVGVDIGNSLYDAEGEKLVPEIKKKAAEKGVEMILPVDFICSFKFGDNGENKSGDMNTGVPEGFLSLDIGPKSIELNDAAIAKSKTVV